MRTRNRRVRGRPLPQRAAQRGMVLPYALFVTVLILILGLAYLQTSATESLVATRNVQRLQANAAAEYGLARACAMADSQHGVWFTMTYNGSLLSWTPSASYGGYEVSNLFTNQAVPSSAEATYSVVIQDLTGDIVNSGTYRIHSYGTVGNYTRHVSLDSQALTFASFGWLTNSENGVWFRTGDWLSGLIWTNGQFNIDGDPTFNGHVYSGSGSLNYMNGGPPTDNPDFVDGITYNAGDINIAGLLSGGEITAIQNVANAGGVSKAKAANGYGYTLTFNSGGTFTLVENGGGSGHSAKSPVTLYNNSPLSAINGVFYFQDTVAVSGTIDGQVTVATSSAGDIDITGNLDYSYPANPATMFAVGFNQSDPLLTSKCALISGGNVVIDPPAWSDLGTDMYITAVCASVSGSFENQYYTSSPQKTLHLYGGITQITRGAVGTTSGTGFLKDYLYDTRFIDVAAAGSAAGRRPVQQLAALFD